MGCLTHLHEFSHSNTDVNNYARLNNKLTIFYSNLDMNNEVDNEIFRATSVDLMNGSV